MDLLQSTRNQMNVSLTLAKHVMLNHGKDCNLVFSPLSIQLFLSLVAAGSNGETRDQLLQFLKSQSTEELNFVSSQLVDHVFADGSDVGGPRLCYAGGIWVDKSVTLKTSFKQVVESLYRATADHVDFQNKAKEMIDFVNSWAEEKTNGLIKDILPDDAVDNLTRLVLANALYFKGTWEEKFDASKTKDQKFHLLNGTTIQAPYMTSKKMQLIRAFDGFKVLRLPYKQGGDKRKFSMHFFLPDSKDGLPALVEKVGSEPQFIERHMPYTKVEVGEFKIPKFKISFQFQASETLKGLGLVLPFCSGGLMEMVDCPTIGKKLYVSKIFHKSLIEVNEVGTEAAAVTVGIVELQCARVYDKLDFVADHPFLFIVKEDATGVVLFIGHVLNPLTS